MRWAARENSILVQISCQFAKNSEYTQSQKQKSEPHKFVFRQKTNTHPMSALKGSPFTALAFETLYNKLNKVSRNEAHTLEQFEKLYGVETTSGHSREAPLFVTWNLDSYGEKELRGCIGTFAAMPLEEGIKEYALVAALEDTRFEPISKSELTKLSCDVTILTDFEPASDVYDWEVGKHGIRISFKDSGRHRSATFLPQVAEEQGWDKKTTLQHLVHKAGGPWKKLDQLDIALTRYKGEKSEMTYNEFLEVKKRL